MLAQVTALKVSSEPIRLLIFAVLGLGWAIPMIRSSPGWSAGTIGRRQRRSAGHPH